MAGARRGRGRGRRIDVGPNQPTPMPEPVDNQVEEPSTEPRVENPQHLYKMRG